MGIMVTFDKEAVSFELKYISCPMYMLIVTLPLTNSLMTCQCEKLACLFLEWSICP